MSDDFCLIHGRDHMATDRGPIPYCRKCETVGEGARMIVYVCSNAKCRAVHAQDPQGHCPVCREPSGMGWSTMPREVLQAKDAVTAPRGKEPGK